jgi:hypothetical protein
MIRRRVGVAGIFCLLSRPPDHTMYPTHTPTLPSSYQRSYRSDSPWSRPKHMHSLSLRGD